MAAKAVEKVRQFMLDENRPYSSLDVCNRLEKEFSKAVIVKALEDLTDREVLKEKVVSKQKIYYANQTQFPTMNAAESKALDLLILQRTNELAELQKTNKSMESELKSLSSRMGKEEISQKVTEIKAEVELLEKKLNGFQSNQKKPVTKEELATAQKDRQKFLVEWRKRKRMANEMFDAILQNLPKKKKEWLEEVGIETDEDKKVQIPPN